MIVSTKLSSVWSGAQWATVPIIAFLENDVFATFGIVAAVNEWVFSRSATASSLTFSRNIGWRQSQLVCFVPFF